MGKVGAGNSQSNPSGQTVDALGAMIAKTDEDKAVKQAAKEAGQFPGLASCPPYKEPKQQHG